MTIAEYKQRILELEKQIADLRTTRNKTAPTRCPECKHKYNASVGAMVELD